MRISDWSANVFSSDLGHPGELYSAEQDRADGKAFIERSTGDRHQFRFIVAPEDGAEYDDLRPFVRRLMTQMEEDLGTKLEWVAVDHYNTGHPHSHIILRGKDGRGRDLVIAREYITKRSEEHTSELQSLMSISYAVLCLKKKIQKSL